VDSGDPDVQLRTPVLTTKVQVPPTRPRLVARARLAAPLDDVWQGRLLLVSAPAGFGKTTLLTEWAQRHQGRVAWLSLDATDNDPVRFWTYVVAALQQVRPGRRRI
jgi:LuxR family maltose regulon positive regulatory protein